MTPPDERASEREPAALLEFCDASRVVIVAGKGGVGKTTVTATLAVAAASAGRNVLIVEVEGKSGIAAMFDRPALGYDVSELGERIRARTLTPDAALVDYLEGHGMRRISKRLASSGALDVVATAVPGMRDILVLGKVKQLDQTREFDLIIVDAPAAGHAISFLMSASALVDAVRLGPIRKQADDVVDLLTDASRCQVMLVTLPEETPVNELVDTAFAVEDRAGVALGPIVVNGCIEALGFDAPDADTVRGWADASGFFVSEREASELAAAAAFWSERAAQQAEQIDRLGARLALPLLRLPFLPTARLSSAEVSTLARSLTGEFAGAAR
jgi:anion-transporting  ArsA/GET3 family ATPase